MKTSITKSIICTVLSLFAMNYLSAQWVDQVGNGVATNYRSVHFTDDNNGVAVGETQVFSRTTDGGANWTAIAVGGCLHNYGVHFSGTNNGIAVGSAGTLFKTTDGGASWSAKTSGTTLDLNSVHLISTTRGIIVGGAGTILKTTDGGETWSNVISGVTNNLIQVQFINSSIGFAIAETSGVIIKTIDGGDSWSTINSPGVIGMRAAYFLDENTAYLSGATTVFKTTNGGADWSIVNYGMGALMYAIHFTDVNNGYMAGQAGIVVETTDAGATWTLTSTPTNFVNDILHAFSFPSSNVGYVVGYPTRILKKGTSTAEMDIEKLSNQFSIFPNPSAGKFNIDSENLISKIEIINTLGQQVSFENNNNEITLLNSEKGIYFVRMFADNKMNTQKIVVE